MTPKEQEIAIGELEERVDRLRNLYEQYFLGFEKLEPTVPRKEVDRRLMVLRKEQIRNTALRFRFQVVTQKYNTYAMHWVRICRQIEEGTYKRHVRKAKARFGDAARAPERDLSVDIEIDMAEFDSIDMDGVLAQADAAAASYERDASDTVPPGAPAPAPARQMTPLRTPGTSFAITGRRESLDDREPNTPPPSVRPAPERVARGAALPQGAKPLILRKRDENEPASQRSIPSAPSAPSAPSVRSAPVVPSAQPSSQRNVQGAPHSAPKLRPMNPASSPRPAAPSSPGLDVPGPPAGPAGAGGPGPAGPRPGAPRIVRSPNAPGGAPGSVPGVPAAPPAASSAGRMPAAAPSAGAPAAGRIPVAAPAPGTSAPRVPAAPPSGQPSGGRIPLPPPSAPNLPAGRPAAPGPSVPRQSAPQQPVPKVPPTSMPRPVPAAPRAPMPSVSDKDSVPPASDPRAGARPRAPLPLPSQLNRPTKKE